MSSSIWSSLPFVAIWSVGYWAVHVPHLLFLSLRNTIKPLRPVPQWSYRLSMGTAVLRAVFRYIGALRYQQPLQLTPGRSGDRFVRIAPPADANLFRGVFGAPSAMAKPAPVSAVWSPAPVVAPSSSHPSDGRRRKVVIYAAGGAFVTGFDPEMSSRFTSALVTSEHFGATNLLFVQYRLATRADPFPGGVLDLFTAYQHVLGLGVAPADIVLIGDSAGGNLVLALLRRRAGLLALGRNNSRSGGQDRALAHQPVRHHGRAGSVLGVDAYRPKGKALTQEEEGYISPMDHPFRLETPLYIEAGGAEGLLESIVTFAGQMADVKGNRVQFHITEDMPHDFFVAYPFIGAKKESCEALKRAKLFLEG
ncbi:uncharacterized protein PG998_008637 [Apiospora kogelbergensis]|uniref:uncharacterized protein n=1 Tax=Apiospora kogelbergensis TaxID=1337665 RepID=UPI003130D20B